MLAQQGIGQTAFTNRARLSDVVRRKKVLFSSSYGNYDACLNGVLQLIQNDRALFALQADYQCMVESGMSIDESEHFENLIEIRELGDSSKAIVLAKWLLIINSI